MSVSFNVEFDARKCTFCMDCVELCPSRAIIMQDEQVITYDSKLCQRCEVCIDVCVNNAIRGCWK